MTSRYSQYLTGNLKNQSGLGGKVISMKTITLGEQIQAQAKQIEIENAMQTNPLLAAYLQSKDNRKSESAATHKAIDQEKRRQAAQHYSAQELRRKLIGFLPTRVIRGMSKDELYAYLHDHRNEIPEGREISELVRPKLGEEGPANLHTYKGNEARLEQERTYPPAANPFEDEDGLDYKHNQDEGYLSDEKEEYDPDDPFSPAPKQIETLLPRTTQSHLAFDLDVPVSGPNTPRQPPRIQPMSADEYARRTYQLFTPPPRPRSPSQAISLIRNIIPAAPGSLSILTQPGSNYSGLIPPPPPPPPPPRVSPGTVPRAPPPPRSTGFITPDVAYHNQQVKNEPRVQLSPAATPKRHVNIDSVLAEIEKFRLEKLTKTADRPKPKEERKTPAQMTGSELLFDSLKKRRKAIGGTRSRKSETEKLQEAARRLFSPPKASSRRAGHGIRRGSGRKSASYVPFGRSTEIDKDRLRTNEFRMRHAGAGYSIQGFSKARSISKELSLLLQTMLKNKSNGDEDWSNLDQYDHFMATMSNDDRTNVIRILTVAGLLKIPRRNAVMREFNRMQTLKKIDVGEIQAGNNSRELRKELNTLKSNGF